MPKTAKSQFTPIQDARTVGRYIRYMDDLKCDVHCAIRETDIRFDTTVIKMPEPRVVHLRLRNELMSPMALKERFNATAARKVDLSFKAHDILIFASTNVRSIDKDGIILEVESPIYKLQRRENLRVKPTADTECWVRFLHPRTRSEVKLVPYDISSGGLSVVVNDVDLPEYAEGQEIKNVNFRFGPHEVLVNTAVMNAVKIAGSSKPRYKIGLKIVAMPAALEQEISRYAYLASQRILGRRIKE